MDESLLAYCNAKNESAKWAESLNLMHFIRRLIIDARGKPVGADVRDPLVNYEIMSSLSMFYLDGASVFLAMDTTTQKFVVVKQYAHHQTDAWGLPVLVLRQLGCSIRLLKAQIQQKKEPKNRCSIKTNIQQILDLRILENFTFIVFKYYPIMFDTVFKPHQPHNVNFISRVVLDLLLSVMLLHETKIAHRDIKLQNLCFDQRSRVVLIDFDSGASSEQMPILRNTTPVCSYHTRPPEHIALQCKLNVQDDIENDQYDAQAGDWWSVGCVIAQMVLNGDHLFEAKSNGFMQEFLDDLISFAQEFQTVCQNKHTTIRHPRVKHLLRASMPEHIKQLLGGLLQIDPSKRKHAAHFYVEHALHKLQK